MGDVILCEPPWVSCIDKSWGSIRSCVVAEYEADTLPGSYRRLTLMLSQAWDEYCELKEPKTPET